MTFNVLEIRVFFVFIYILLLTPDRSSGFLFDITPLLKHTKFGRKLVDLVAGQHVRKNATLSPSIHARPLFGRFTYPAMIPPSPSTLEQTLSDLTTGPTSTTPKPGPADELLNFDAKKFDITIPPSEISIEKGIENGTFTQRYVHAPKSLRLELPCSTGMAAQSPFTDFQWSLRNLAVNSTPGGVRLNIGTKKELIFEALDPTDSGRYTCNANVKGILLVNVVHLHVVVPADIALGFPFTFRAAHCNKDEDLSIKNQIQQIFCSTFQSCSFDFETNCRSTPWFKQTQPDPLSAWLKVLVVKYTNPSYQNPNCDIECIMQSKLKNILSEMPSFVTAFTKVTETVRRVGHCAASSCPSDYEFEPKDTVEDARVLYVCDAGYILYRVSACVPCWAGEFSKSRGPSEVCTHCPMLTYQPKPASASCISCGNATTRNTSITGAMSSDICNAEKVTKPFVGMNAILLVLVIVFLVGVIAIIIVAISCIGKIRDSVNKTKVSKTPEGGKAPDEKEPLKPGEKVSGVSIARKVSAFAVGREAPVAKKVSAFAVGREEPVAKKVSAFAVGREEPVAKKVSAFAVGKEEPVAMKVSAFAVGKEEPVAMKVSAFAVGKEEPVAMKVSAFAIGKEPVQVAPEIAAIRTSSKPSARKRTTDHRKTVSKGRQESAIFAQPVKSSPVVGHDPTKTANFRTPTEASKTVATSATPFHLTVPAPSQAAATTVTTQPMAMPVVVPVPVEPTQVAVYAPVNTTPEFASDETNAPEVYSMVPAATQTIQPQVQFRTPQPPNTFTTFELGKTPSEVGPAMSPVKPVWSRNFNQSSRPQPSTISQQSAGSNRSSVSVTQMAFPTESNKRKLSDKVSNIHLHVVRINPEHVNTASSANTMPDPAQPVYGKSTKIPEGPAGNITSSPFPSSLGATDKSPSARVLASTGGYTKTSSDESPGDIWSNTQPLSSAAIVNPLGDMTYEVDTTNPLNRRRSQYGATLNRQRYNTEPPTVAAIETESPGHDADETPESASPGPENTQHREGSQTSLAQPTTQGATHSNVNWNAMYSESSCNEELWDSYDVTEVDILVDGADEELDSGHDRAVGMNNLRRKLLKR